MFIQRAVADIPAGLTAADPHELLMLARTARRLPSWIRSVRAVHGGSYLSSFRGRGMEYDESRLYQPGDDIRYLDSRVTARRGEPFTKVFREERERPVFICIDDRASMHFASQGRFKRVIAAMAGALIAWKAFYQGDRIGALVFTENDAHVLPAGRGRSAVIRVLNQLSRPARRDTMTEAQLTVSLQRGFDKLRRSVRPGSLLFVFSDFRGLHDHADAELLRLRGHCDIVLGQIFDSLERELPMAPGHYRMANEQAEVNLQGADAAAQARLNTIVSTRQQRIDDLARTLRARLLSLATTCDPASEIRQLLRNR